MSDLRLVSRTLIAVLILLGSWASPARATDAGTGDGGAVSPSFPMYLGMPVEPVRGQTVIEGARTQVVLDPALQGDEVHHAFVIRNDGAGAMTLTNVKACKGCILDGYNSEIGPGRTGAISIVIPTDPLGGQTLRGTVRAETSDPARPLLEIDVMLPVVEFARLEPYRVWLKGRVGDPIVATCIVVPSADYPFEISGIKTRKGAWFDLAYGPTTHEGRPAYEITLTNTRTRPGPYQDVLFIQTTHPARPELKVRVEGRLEAQP